MNPSASRCFICGYKTVLNDEKHLPMFVVTKSRKPEWEKVLPQEGFKVGVKLCGDHFDDDDILKGKIVSGNFYAYKRHRLATGALPKHYLDGSKGQEPKFKFPNCEQPGNLHSCCEVDGALNQKTKGSSSNCNQFGHHIPSCKTDESQGQENNVSSSICNHSGNLHSCIDVDSLTRNESLFPSNDDQRRGFLQASSGKVAELEFDDVAVKRLKFDHCASQQRYSRAMKKTRNVGAVLNGYGEPLTLEMIHPPTSDQLLHFESDPIAALMNLITNTGLDRFRDADHLADNWKHAASNPQPPLGYLTNLSEEIISNVTEANLGVIAEKFLKDWDIEAQMFGCASCGMKDFAMGPAKFHAVSLDQLSRLLISAPEVIELERIPEKFRPVVSYYLSPVSRKYYYLHREFVTRKRQMSSDGEDIETTVLCNECFQAVIRQSKLPTYSLASGIDFGNTDRIFLPRLTLAEEHVIAFARLFIVVINSHDRTHRKYPYITDFYDTLNIFFVGSHLQWTALVADKLHKVWHPIQVRSEVIYMWMGALKQFNSRYRDVDIDDTQEMKSNLTSSSTGLSSREAALKGISDTLGQSADLRYHKTRTKSSITSNEETFDDTAKSSNPSASREKIPQTEYVTIEQEDEPLNEFEQNDYLMYSAFPHLFPLGRRLRKTESIPIKDMRHMELQWHGKFASCLRLLFLLFDQWQRHNTCRIIQATVRSNVVSLGKFSQMVADPTFGDQLEKAKNNPNHPKSLERLAKIAPHLSQVSKKVPYSVATRSATVGHLMRMVRYFGPPSIFYTHSPDDTNGLLNLRFTLPILNNWDFPATESGFGEAMRNHQSDFNGISVSESAKKIILTLGPVSAARMFQILTEAFFVHMFGTPPDGTGKKKYSLMQTPSRNLRNTSGVLWLYGRTSGDLFTGTFCFGEDYPQTSYRLQVASQLWKTSLLRQSIAWSTTGANGLPQTPVERLAQRETSSCRLL
uniref:THAP-type domain-containing protein n=1 Tax=Daphnia galeata TaxID=27404 RepID=A0A8J2R7J0_9CRUS|nr:unnamed protein product [Daphnia galeata]